jgi:hypothetical protein
MIINPVKFDFVIRFLNIQRGKNVHNYFINIDTCFVKKVLIRVF